MAVRPYWSGQIRLSLVSLPVNIYSAINRSSHIPLHEIDRESGQRIHHQNVADGEPVEREDIIKGYEVEKGRYVLIEPDEILELKIPSKKTLEIVQFVPTGSIDPRYFESAYYVAPDGKSAQDAFAVIREALRVTDKVGIGQLAIAGHERLCAITPYGQGILLEALRYHEEIRDAEPYFEDIGDVKIDKDQLDLAKELIKRKTAPFKPEKFHDHYREALQELIDARLEDREPLPIEEEKPVGKVVNLMDALRRSLKEPEKAKTKAKSRQRNGKAATRKRTG